MAGDRVRPLAGAVALLFLLGSVTGVLRTASDPSETGPAEPVAAADPTPAPAGPDLGAGDALPLSDPQSLDLTAAGYDLPPMGSVYAARIVGGGDAGAGDPLRYVDYVAGGGALARDFWPASSIKLLTALGALDYVGSLGFTGAATVSFDDYGYTATLREIYRSAILASDNLDYDMLILVAGFDRLNTAFLSQANGFPTTVIERSYSGVDIRWSPEMTLEEDGRTAVVAPRAGTGDYDCPDEGNCTDLFEMSEAVRRLVLHASVPAQERFAISPGDVDALSDALAGAGSFFASGAERVLGPGATVLSKPGVASGLDCVDSAVVTGPGGDRFLLSAAIPDDGYEPECEGLSDLAAAVLSLLATS
jgi:hypothetical protein